MSLIWLERGSDFILLISILISSREWHSVFRALRVILPLHQTPAAPLSPCGRLCFFFFKLEFAKSYFFFIKLEIAKLSMYQFLRYFWLSHITSLSRTIGTKCFGQMFERNISGGKHFNKVLWRE